MGAADVGGADGLSGTAEANIAYGLVEPGADEIIVEGLFGASRQQVRIGIGSPQAAAHGQIISDLDGHRPGDRDEAVLFKLGFFDIKSVVVGAEVMPLKAQRFVNTHAAAGQKQNRQVDAQLLDKIRGLPAQAAAEGLQQLIDLRR